MERNQFFSKSCITMLILVSFACGSSHSREKYLWAFENFVEEVELNAEQYDDEEWEEMVSQFQFFTEFQYLLYKAELTDEENQKIGELIARYTQVTAKIKSKDFMDELKEQFEDQKEVLKGFLKEMGGE